MNYYKETGKERKKRRKEKRKTTDRMIGQKRREIWFKVSTARRAGMKEHDFRKMSIVITSGIRCRLDTSS